MSYMNSIEDNLGNFYGMRGKYEEIKNNEASGSLEDKGKALLDKLRAHLEK